MDTYGDIEFQSGKLLHDGRNYGIEVVANITERNNLTNVLDGTVIMTADDHVLNIYCSETGRWNKLRNFTVSEIHSPVTDPTYIHRSDSRSMFTDINNCNSFYLPDAIVGREFSFYKTKEANFYIHRTGSDLIDDQTTLQNTTTELYVSCLLKCIIDGHWLIINKQGNNWVST